MRITISIILLLFATLVYGQTNVDKVDDPVEYIKRESIGGKLDFNLVLANENKGFYLFDGIAYNKKDFAIFLWGQAVKRLGIHSSKKASKLWVEINKRELTAPENKALKRGFDLDIK